MAVYCWWCCRTHPGPLSDHSCVLPQDDPAEVRLTCLAVLQNPDLAAQLEQYLQPFQHSYTVDPISEYETYTLEKPFLWDVVETPDLYTTLAKGLNANGSHLGYKLRSEVQTTPCSVKKGWLLLATATTQCKNSTKTFEQYVVVFQNPSDSHNTVFSPLMSFKRQSWYKNEPDHLQQQSFRTIRTPPNATLEQLTYQSLQWCIWFIHACLRTPMAVFNPVALLALPFQYPPSQHYQMFQGLIDRLMRTLAITLERYRVFPANELDERYGVFAVNQFQVITEGVCLVMKAVVYLCRIDANTILDWEEFDARITERLPVLYPPQVPWHATTILAQQLDLKHGSLAVFPTLSPELMEILEDPADSICCYEHFQLHAFKTIGHLNKDGVLADFMLETYYDQHSDTFKLTLWENKISRPLTSAACKHLYSKMQGRRLAALYLSLDGNTENDMHANLLFINKDLRIIEHYEPNGTAVPGTGYGGMNLCATLKRTFAEFLPGYTYMEPSYICPDRKYGYQTIVCREPGVSVAYKGSCLFWCLYFANDRLQYPGLSAPQVFRNTYRQLIPTIQQHGLQGEIHNFMVSMSQLMRLRFEPGIFTCDLDAMIEAEVKGSLREQALRRCEPLVRRGHQFSLLQLMVGTNTTIRYYFDLYKQPNLTIAQEETLRYMHYSASSIYITP